ncbi:Cysteine proteinase inhibitor 5 [Sesamum angolense]|uniref:Cysteine proteinase inhibitor 5 n=1 Tax=Sesamum angolense TaxID=2727404 RepID=A0AAE2BV66_9LAMI|nr:Cysteine proteinase inhibitor 5 [Sesamum angolense]
MAHKSLSLLCVFLAILLASALSEASPAWKREKIVGGWRPIDNPKDPEGESQVVSGTNFRLVIAAKDGSAAESKQYQALVWDKPWQKFRKLLSFEEIKG